MIIFDMRSQWLMLLCSLGVGIFLGVLYDIFRISRLFLTLPSECTSARYYRMLPRVRLFAGSKQITGDIDAEPDALSIRLNNFAVGVVAFVEDIMYFCLCGAIISVFLYNLNTGKVRGFVLIGAICGFAFYLLTIGRVTLFFGELIVFLIRSLARLVFLRLILPTARAVQRIVGFIYIHTFGKVRGIIKSKSERRAREKRRRQLCEFCSKLAEYAVLSNSYQTITNIDNVKTNRLKNQMTQENKVTTPIHKNGSTRRARGCTNKS